MSASGSVEILVWNANAELAAKVTDQKPPGAQSSQLNLQGFASGIYFYRVLLTYDSGQVERLKPGKFVIEH
jgi:hypothetical protein